MKGRQVRTIFAVAVAFLFMNSPVLGQMDCCKGMAEGMDMGKGCCQMMGHGMAAEPSGAQYDPATEATLSGAIEEIREHPGMGKGTGVHLLLRTDQEVLEIHLGPAALLAEWEMSLAVGDQLEVIGSRIEFEDAFIVLARQVKNGDQILPLRTPQGQPLWAGGNPGMSRKMGHSCCQENR